MILTFPYHDPTGKYNNIFKKNISLLKKIFSYIVVSTTPDTYKKNTEFINYLLTKGIIIFKNKYGSSIGDHFRNALLIATNKLNN